MNWRGSMADLSPAARAVLDAFCTYADLLNREVSHEEMLAAALCAAVDQVVPDEPNESPYFTNEAVRLNRMGTRCKILAIAAELGGSMANPTPADRLALAMCPYIKGVCRVPASDCRHYCRRNAAAVARELAEQVVPNGPSPSADSDYHLMQWSKSLDQYAQRQQTRAEILAIVAELNDPPQ
jgi:hypothetical protein